MASNWESVKTSIQKIKLLRMKTPIGWLEDIMGEWILVNNHNQ